LVQLLDSEISTSVRGGGGDAGNIKIISAFLVLAGSQVISNAFGGRGGNLLLSGTEVFLLDQESDVRASTLGIGGLALPLSGALAPLPQAFANVAVLLPVRCAARYRGGKASSLVLGGRQGLPAEPGSVLPSPLALEERLAADPAVMERPHRPPSRAMFALLADQEKALPRLGCPK
jgi:hypothetical protein